MISARAEARRNLNNSLIRSHPPSSEAGLIVIVSSTGEFDSTNLMNSNSDLMPEMPTIFTIRSWENREVQWSTSQKLVRTPIPVSSGRAYIRCNMYD